MTDMAPAIAQFVNPTLFAWGAAAAALPIVIHLLARRRFKRIRWAAMDFLVDAQRRNRRRTRLEELILLALRCLAVLLIALLIGRPFVSSSSIAAAWGGRQQVERIVVLDDSFSMGYRHADGTSMERAKRAAARLLEAVRRESPGDTFSLLRMTAPDAPIEVGAYLDASQSSRLLARIEPIQPSTLPIQPARVIEEVAELLRRGEGLTSAAVYFVSDFQHKDWARTGPGTSPEGAANLLAPLNDWATEGRSLRVVLINVADPQAANQAVTSLSHQGGRVVVGTPAPLHLEVANYSPQPVTGLPVRLAVGASSLPEKILDRVDARTTTRLSAEADLLRPGFESIRVQLPDDALPLDNARDIAVEAAAALRILVVNGEPSGDAFDDEVSLLVTALRPEGQVFSGMEPVVVDEAAFDQARLDDFDAVILANVYRVSEPAAEALERFVSAGGGLLILLGDQVDPALYNATLFREGDGVLPAELTERSTLGDVAQLLVLDRLHPALAGMGGEADPLGLAQVPFFEAISSRLPSPGSASTTTDVDATGTEPASNTAAAAADRSPRLLARFNDADQTPAILESAFGQGRVVLFTSTADKEWNLWPDHPTYLPVMLEFVRYVASGKATDATVPVGESISLVLDSSEYRDDVLIRTPAFPDEAEINLSARPLPAAERLGITWDDTLRPGIYQFLLARHDGAEEVRMVSAVLDPLESDVLPADEAALRQSMPEPVFDYVQGMDELDAQTGETRTELWRLALLAAVAVLLTEQGLAWKWGRKR